MNRAAHQFVASASIGVYLAKHESEAGTQTIKPLLGGGAAAFFTNFPDILEPATSPNHRGIFHSLAFAALLGTCLHRLHEWHTETELESLLRGLGMIAVSAYLIHLALDFTTAKSLPLVR